MFDDIDDSEDGRVSMEEFNAGVRKSVSFIARRNTIATIGYIHEFLMSTSSRFLRNIHRANNSIQRAYHHLPMRTPASAIPKRTYVSFHFDTHIIPQTRTHMHVSPSGMVAACSLWCKRLRRCKHTHARTRTHKHTHTHINKYTHIHKHAGGEGMLCGGGGSC